MNGPFQGSRLSNLRPKNTNENSLSTKQQSKPLALQLQDQSGYMPSMAVQGGRTVTRFLKGRIQKTSNNEVTSVSTTSSSTQQTFTSQQQNNNNDRKPSMKLNEPQDGDLKLVLNDSPQFTKKTSQAKIAPQQPQQKRVLIQKKQEKQQPVKPVVKQQHKEQSVNKVTIKTVVNKVQEQVIAPNSQSAKIQQQEVEESKQENQNQLVQCTEGCGRKFNRKALEKHVKACKLVFMSKRKEFNSEAKRLTSTEQAALIKQNKLQQKKQQMAMTKGKGFQKTGENWKAASEDFRSAIKAIKKDDKQEGDEEGEEKMKTAACEYCQKQFAQVLLGKHLQNCVKKKEKQLKDKKKTGKKK